MRLTVALLTLACLAACEAPKIVFPVYYSQCVPASESMLVCKAMPAKAETQP